MKFDSASERPAKMMRSDIGSHYDELSFTGNSSRPSELQTPNTLADSNIVPSKVLQVRDFPPSCMEAELMMSLKSYGNVTDCTIIPSKRQALVEFENISQAQLVVDMQNQRMPIRVAGCPVNVSFSPLQTLSSDAPPPPQNSSYPAYNPNPSYEDPPRPQYAEYQSDSHPSQPMRGEPPSRGFVRPFSSRDLPPNKVLLFTVLKPDFPINVSVINAVCSKFHPPVRIMIFRKSGVQAMVEFEDINQATYVRDQLDNNDIYSNCCTIRAEFAKPEKLNIRRNTEDSYDVNLPQDPFSTNAAASGSRQSGGPPPPPPAAYGAGRALGDAMGGDRRGDYGPPPNQGGGYGYRDGGYRNDMPPMDYRQPMPDAGMLEPCVVMVHGLNHEKFDPSRLFNLLCIFGNVNKVKFLKSKPGSAMIEMAGRDAIQRIFDGLRGLEVFGSKLSVSTSRQSELYEGNQLSSETLPTGQPYFRSFMGSRDQRFSTPEQRAKNRPQIPGETLHVFNVPRGVDDGQVRKVLEDAGCGENIKRVSLLEAKNETAGRIAGSIQFKSTQDAAEALILANYAKIEDPSSGKVVPLKLCFAQPERERRN